MTLFEKFAMNGINCKFYPEFTREEKLQSWLERTNGQMTVMQCGQTYLFAERGVFDQISPLPKFSLVVSVQDFVCLALIFMITVALTASEILL